MPMATTTMIKAEKVESQCPRTLPASPRAFRIAARAFLRLPGVDVVWLAVRESRMQAAVIRSSEGTRSTIGLGLRIEPGVGVGGALLLAEARVRGQTARGAAMCPRHMRSAP